MIFFRKEVERLQNIKKRQSELKQLLAKKKQFEKSVYVIDEKIKIVEEKKEEQKQKQIDVSVTFYDKSDMFNTMIS